MQIVNELAAPVDIQALENEEQALAQKVIAPDDVVLELGARYGSVSCVINRNLRNKLNQVVVEPDARTWGALEHNKRINGCGFHIVQGFISNQPQTLTNLAHHHNGYGATSIDSTTSTVPHYSLQQVEAHFQLRFNVLVADCEGFLERFLDENPQLYDQLRLIMFEADYPDKCDYNKIRAALRQHGFQESVRGAPKRMAKTQQPSQHSDVCLDAANIHQAAAQLFKASHRACACSGGVRCQHKRRDGCQAP